MHSQNHHPRLGYLTIALGVFLPVAICSTLVVWFNNTSMGDEEIFMGVLPMILGGIFVGTSAICMKTTKSSGQTLAFVVVLLPALMAEISLLTMLTTPAWPTFLPHLLLIFCFLVTAGQVVTLLAKKA